MDTLKNSKNINNSIKYYAPNKRVSAINSRVIKIIAIINDRFILVLT